MEVLVDGKVIDLVRANGELVEVQTGHLSQLKSKALELAASGYRLRIVYPVSAERQLRRLDPATGALISARKSPKRDDMYRIFDELVRAPELVAARNITLEILIVKSVETKIRDGSGSWWRKGDRTVDKELVEIISSSSFGTKDQWLSFIPKNLPMPWTSMSLGAALGISPERARKILYSFCRAGLLVESGKEGRYKAYKKALSERAK